MTTGGRTALGNGPFILGCVAAALLPLAIVDMVTHVPYVPEAWWKTGEFLTPSGAFDLRMMVICPGPVGWLGMWGFLFALVWMPIAGYRAWRGIRAGVGFRPVDRILFMLIPSLVLVIELILHLTPLKYGYPLP